MNWNCHKNFIDTYSILPLIHIKKDRKLILQSITRLILNIVLLRQSHENKWAPLHFLKGSHSRIVHARAFGWIELWKISRYLSLTLRAGHNRSAWTRWTSPRYWRTLNKFLKNMSFICFFPKSKIYNKVNSMATLTLMQFT